MVSTSLLRQRQRVLSSRCASRHRAISCLRLIASQYLESLGSLFNVLLLLSGVLQYVLLGLDYENNKANTYLGGILIAVAFMNAFIDWYQGQKAESIVSGSSRAILELELNICSVAILLEHDAAILPRPSRRPNR